MPQPSPAGMSSVVPVPEFAATGAGRLTVRAAWPTIRQYGIWPLLRESSVRFRYGDGFSHARALGLQLVLATIPLIIAGVGVTSALRTERTGLLLRRTILDLTPGASKSLVRTTLSPISDDTDANVAALVLGLLFALTALVTAMGQLERGANRIYGIQRDRPSRSKYLRALGMTAIAGVPATTGFLLLITSEAFADAVEAIYGLDDDVIQLLTRPVGVGLLVVAITVSFKRSPARRQPPWSLLAVGAALTLALWLALTALLAGFLHLSADIGSIYGPLTGIIALLAWAQLTAAALLFGVALSAQLEAAHLGRPDAAGPDEAASDLRATVVINPLS